MSLREAMVSAAERLRALPAGRRDVELLLLRVLGRDKAWLLAHADAELTPEQISQFEGWLARRARNEPVQYIVGETEFYGLALRVTPEVLIPRPETEHLVEAVVERVPGDAAMRICDVGTGSGAIAVALAHALPWAEVTALDLSPGALRIAAENAERHGVAERIRFLESDLLAAVRGERFDVVVSNPPYIAGGEILEAQVREYEPRGALFAGPTGLEVYRRLIPEAWEVLSPGGSWGEWSCGEKDAPQGLKPPISSAGYDTAEAVSLQSGESSSPDEAMPLGSSGSSAHRGAVSEQNMQSFAPNQAVFPQSGWSSAHSEAVAQQRGKSSSPDEADLLQKNQVFSQAAGGWLLMEMGHGQREAVAGLLSGWDEVGFVDDLQGIPRVAMARRCG